MSAFSEALQELSKIESEEDRLLKATLIDSQIDESMTGSEELEKLQADVEKLSKERDDANQELADVKMKYAKLYFSSADVDNGNRTRDNSDKPVTMKDILG